MKSLHRFTIAELKTRRLTREGACRSWSAIVLSVIVLLPWITHAAEPAPWQTHLYLSAGQLFTRRIAITVRNDSNSPLAGQILSLPIPASGALSEIRDAIPAQLRLTNAGGEELLFAFVGPDGKPANTGPIVSGVELRIPAECPAKSTTMAYLYLANAAAWPVPDFLDVREKPVAAAVASATAGPVETLALRMSPDPAAWPAQMPGHRLSALAINQAAAPFTGLVSIDISALTGYCKARHYPTNFSSTLDGKPLPCCPVGNALIVQSTIAPATVQSLCVYSSGTAPLDAAYVQLLDSPANLVKNASFEEDSSAWQGAVRRADGAEAALVAPGRFGRRASRVTVPETAKPNWIGLHQDVPVLPNATYFYAAWIKCQSVKTGSVQLHVHLCNSAGQLTKTGSMHGAGPAISGDTDWTLISGQLTTPPDAQTLQLHLTTNTTGTVWHDGVIVAQVMPALVGPIESRLADEPATLGAWPMNPIVKVFRHDLPPAKPDEVRITAARNEKEPIQIAVRSRQSLADVRIAVDAPRLASGAVLKEFQTAVVKYVPIDYPTNYYQSPAPAWQRKLPIGSPGCDGWSDFWPDPLVSADSLDIPAQQTQPVWVTFNIPKDAPAGDYRGAVRFVHEQKTIATVPFVVHVWDFALDDQSHVKAVYDVRVGGRWKQPGKSDSETWRQVVQLMADHRLCPDTIAPAPQLKYVNGTVVADFTEFDKVASWYFDELKILHAYTPHDFYGFGWGLPPRKAFGEEAFEGSARTALRPQYKEAYQACLRAFWNHVKEKGWAGKILLYISDEPFDREPAIRDQMKTLCAMIHEVDPTIPIYASTWHHVPEWDGSVTAWGFGHFGVVPAEKIASIRNAGTKVLFTTDGHMCTDTPYCAVERLLPHYCFKYDVEGYEFWGSTWLTYDPFQFGWHSFIHQTDAPGKSYFIRYPNGDGYLIYPSKTGPVSTIRLEQASEGVEDYEYLYILRGRIATAKAAGRDTAEAQRTLDAANALVSMPNSGGRYSTRFLDDPDKVLQSKAQVARAIESLK